jgi:hypothetical protein
MELEVHIVELSNRVSERIDRTWGFGVFHPETFQSMGKNARLLGKMAYELALLAPHTPELLKMRKELRNRNEM